MEKFKYLLDGRKFLLYTDHKAIEEIKKKKESRSLVFLDGLKDEKS